MPSAPADRLRRIVAEGMCLGCGLCEAIAGADTLPMHVTIDGALRPHIPDDVAATLVDRIEDLCPGVHVEGLPDHRLDAGTAVDPVWGPWRQLAEAWAADPSTRHEGSTGGVLTALGQYLLVSGRVGFVLHTRASADHPTFGEATISRTAAEVTAAAGSRYGPTATLVGVNEALEIGEPFAVVAKPCDLAALDSLARHDPRVDELVRYRLTMVCGGFGTTPFTDRFLATMGLTRDDLTGFRYRGLGCPGPTTAHTSGGSSVSRHYLDYWGDGESSWEIPWRCRLCPDGIGEVADIAAADSWAGGSPRRSDTTNDPGTNAIIVRTKVGEELLDAAVANGALTVGAALSIDDLSRFQPHQVTKKLTGADRIAGLVDAGRLPIRTARLRLAELAATRPDIDRHAERFGTRRRADEGRGAEAL
ncbi:MAG: Coenzyme F420 hydrogenase/dehydrogenase, beta subunit C-terminal domain [Actinomycetota bacterium]